MGRFVGGTGHMDRESVLYFKMKASLIILTANGRYIKAKELRRI